MCLAMPRRVLRLQGDRVQVDGDGEPLWVAAGGILDLVVGDYVLVHAGLVLDRLSAEEADQIMELLASVEGADVNILVGEPDSEVRV